MENIIFIALGFGLMSLGLLGCFIYKIPGPILSFIGILVLQFGTDFKPFTTGAMIICGAAVILCKVLEKLAPKLVAKIHPFGKGGKMGCMIGSLIGILLFIPATQQADPLHVLTMCFVSFALLPFVLAALFEFVSRKDFTIALKAGAAAWINFLSNTMLQLAVSIYCIYTAFQSV